MGIVMGAAMDGAALKAGADAHHKAIMSSDAKGLTSLEDYTAVNAAIGHMVASAGQAKTMDVYNAFAGFKLGGDVGPYMVSKVDAADAKAAYSAFLKFKDVVLEVHGGLQRSRRQRRQLQRHIRCRSRAL